MNDRDELDEIIDCALSGYAGAEPLDGLEDRVLQRTRNLPIHRKPLYLGLSFASALLVLLAVILFQSGRRQHAPVQRQVAQVAVQAPTAVELHPETRPRLRVKAKAKPFPRRTPKLDRFPIVSPLTEEERALLAFVRQHPEDALLAFNNVSKQSGKPLVIEPIQIQPLTNGTAR